MVAGCAVQTPSIAHTHVGHAITGFDGTPRDKGLFTVAEQRATEAKRLADELDTQADAPEAIKAQVDRILEETAADDYGLRQAIDEAGSHISFAARSIDASSNLRTTSSRFSSSVDAVIDRCDLLVLAANDLRLATSEDEIRVLAERVQELAGENVTGDDSDGDGVVGSTASEYGVTQLRRELDALVDRELPPYQPVETWYLFHLVRLPDCETCWAWRKWANSSNRGY